jgi:hypothetical protein
LEGAVTDNGAAITHCTFVNTGYTAPGPFPFACFIGPDNIPATTTELQIRDHVVVLTCVAPPSR